MRKKQVRREEEESTCGASSGRGNTRSTAMNVQRVAPLSGDSGIYVVVDIS